MQDKNDKRGGQKNPLSGEAEQLPLVPQMLKQPNELTRSFYRCSGTAQKLFMAAVATFVGEKKSAGDRWLVIKFKETLQSFSIVDGSETRDTFRKAVEEISELSVVLLDDGNSYHKLNLFEEALFDWRKGVIEFKPSEKFAAFLEVEHRRGYTLFNIESVGKLSSFYAMRYFEIAMSYKGFMGHVKSSDGWAESNGVDLGRSWFFSYSISELKKLFMIGEGQYKLTQNFVKKVINAPIDELNRKIPEYVFRVQVVRKNSSPRSAITDFIFWVTDVSGGGGKSPFEADLPDIESARAFIDGVRSAVPEEFDRRLADRLANKKAFEMDILLEMAVAKSIEDDGLLPQPGVFEKK